MSSSIALQKSNSLSTRCASWPLLLVPEPLLWTWAGFPNFSLVLTCQVFLLSFILPISIDRFIAFPRPFLPEACVYELQEQHLCPVSYLPPIKYEPEGSLQLFSAYDLPYAAGDLIEPRNGYCRSKRAICGILIRCDLDLEIYAHSNLNWQQCL